MSEKGLGLMVKVGYYPLDIYLGHFILPFLVKQLDFAPIGSKNEGSGAPLKRAKYRKSLKWVVRGQV